MYLLYWFRLNCTYIFCILVTYWVHASNFSMPLYGSIYPWTYISLQWQCVLSCVFAILIDTNYCVVSRIVKLVINSLFSFVQLSACTCYNVVNCICMCCRHNVHIMYMYIVIAHYSSIENYASVKKMMLIKHIICLPATKWLHVLLT